jgi:Cu-processing system ATP-binding protein
MISINSVNKKFGSLTALSNINLDLEAGRSYALVGPNGSGKTTLIKSILGLVLPTSGVISFDGTPISRHWQYREHIGYMPQISHFPHNITIGQLIGMIRNFRGSANADEELVDAFGIVKLYKKPMHSLSGGTRQKVSAALAFLFDPPVLILDEPTAGLDPVSVEILKEKIIEDKRRGKLIIVTSHIMSDLEELTTELAYIFEGKLQYNDSIDALKEETGQDKLGKAIAQLITRKQLIYS